MDGKMLQGPQRGHAPMNIPFPRTQKGLIKYVMALYDVLERGGDPFDTPPNISMETLVNRCRGLEDRLRHVPNGDEKVQIARHNMGVDKFYEYELKEIKKQARLEKWEAKGTGQGRKYMPKDIDRLAEREDFGGYGFIGTCEYQTQRVQQKARTAVCRAATELKLSEDQFFEWLNSKPGRHYFDNCDDSPKQLKKDAVESMKYMLRAIKDGSWHAPIRVF